MAARAPDTITDPAGVAEVVAAARAAGRAALDLEFLWERTYAPLACLAQVAVEHAVYLVDPIAGAPLEPLAELVADPGVTVVMHAPSSDLALLELAFGTRPAALRDVQTAAGFVGLGAGQGLATLLDRVLGVRLDKGERYTDWSRRPLTRRQLEYAGADVSDLLALSDALDDRARALDREEWVAEEHARRFGPDARFTQEPDEAWRKIKGQGRLGPRDRAVLRALAAWREREARGQDRPAGWLVPDRTLVEVARRRPADAAALASERGLPERLRPPVVEGMLAAIRDGEGAPPITLPAPPSRAVAERLDVLGPLGAVLVSARAAAVDLAPSLLATRDEINAHLVAAMADEGDVPARGTRPRRPVADADDEGGGPLASGWRRELAGDALRELARGRMALAADPRRPYLVELPRGNAPEGAPAPLTNGRPAGASDGTS